MVTELSSGPFIALEIGCHNSNESPYQPFRQLCGPFDPVIFLKFEYRKKNRVKIIFILNLKEIAREIRPKSIRAMFGVSPIKNAVHCTDLAEDCSLEVEYFFKILSQ